MVTLVNGLMVVVGGGWCSNIRFLFLLHGQFLYCGNGRL